MPKGATVKKSMAASGREMLSQAIVAWLEDPAERAWVRETNPKPWHVYARFATWLRSEFAHASSDLTLNEGLSNKLVSSWLLNLPGWFASYDLAGNAALERSLGFSLTPSTTQDELKNE
jgi:hypothetical protein